MQKDQIFIDGIKNGNDIIIKMFYRKNFCTIKGHIIRNSGNIEDAEDVFQDALVITYQKLKSNTLIIETSIHGYFYGVCKMLWLNRLRKRKKLLITDSLDFYSNFNECTILEDIEVKDRERLYQKYFLKLNSSNRQILRLFFTGKNMREISKITGYTEGYVRKKKFESKEKLLRMLQKDKTYLELNNKSTETAYLTLIMH